MEAACTNCKKAVSQFVRHHLHRVAVPAYQSQSARSSLQTFRLGFFVGRSRPITFTTTSTTTATARATPNPSAQRRRTKMTAAATSLSCAPPKSCVVRTHQKSIYCQTQVDADFVNFTIGQPTPRLLPLEELRSSLNVQLAAENADPLMIQYGGTSTQLDVLARWLAKKLKMEVAASELILTNGNSHGIQFAARALCAPGDSLLMDDPTYFLVGDILQSHCKVAVLPCTVSEDFTSESDASVVQRTSLTAGMTRFVDALEAYLGDDSKPKPKAIYTIPVHHNPTAGSFSVAAAKKLVALARKYNFYIFADEPYVLLNHELEQGVEKNKNSEVGGSLPDDLQPIRTSLRYYDIVTDEHNRTTPGRHVISMGSFSKIIAPGLRLGWLHAHADVVANHFTKDPVIVSGGGVNPVSSLAVLHMIQAGKLDSYLNKINKIYTERARALCAALRSCFGEGRVEFAEPAGGYFLWLRFLEPRDFNTKKFHEFVMARKEKYGVSFLPGRRCAVQLKMGANHEAAASMVTDSAAAPEDMVSIARPDEGEGGRHRFDSHIRMSWAFFEVEELEEGVRRLYHAYSDFNKMNTGQADALPQA